MKRFWVREIEDAERGGFGLRQGAEWGTEEIEEAIPGLIDLFGARLPREGHEPENEYSEGASGGKPAGKVYVHRSVLFR